MKNLRLITLFLLLSLPFIASAATPQQQAEITEILRHAKTVQAEQKARGSIALSPKEELLTVIQGHDYTALGEMLNTADLPFREVELFKTYNALIVLPHEEAVQTTAMDSLKSIAISADTSLAHDAQILLSVYHLKRNMVAQGLHHAAEAVNSLQIIGDNQSDDRQQYFAYQLLLTAMILDQNFGGAVDVAQRFVTLAQETGLDVNYITLSTNFAYLYTSQNFDKAAFEVTSNIVEDAKSLGEPIANHIYFTHGKSALKIGELSVASQYLERSITLGANHATYSTALAYQASALARLGQTEKAQTNIEIIKTLLDQDYKKNSLKLLVERAQIDIAFARGDHKLAYARLEDWAEQKLTIAQDAITQNRNEMSNEVLIAQKVNETKISALETEAKLQNELFERERKNKQWLSFAAIILFAISLALFLQKRRVKSLNADLSIARDEALESERVKTDFLAMVSHEVRTPLNAIIPLVDIMLSQEQAKAERNFLNIIQENAQALLSMFENILTIASDQSHLEYVDTVDLRKEIAQIAKAHVEPARMRGNVLSLKMAQNLIQTANLDKRVLRRCLDNIIENANKFTQNGEINITVRQSQNLKSIHIQVQDTGIGCNEMNDAALFDAFVQSNMSRKRSFEGLGIGLATCKTLLESVQGSIRRETCPVGSCFVINLPVEAAEAINSPLAQRQAA